MFWQSTILTALSSRVEELAQNFLHLRKKWEAIHEKNENQREQIECLRVRTALCEVILANILARNVNCIVGSDYYLERIKEVRATDPDGNSRTPE